MDVMPHKRKMTLSPDQWDKERCIAFIETKGYEGMTAREIVDLQLYQQKLCVPFGLFQKSMEEVLGRPVFTHEFAWPEELQDELAGLKEKGSLGSALALLDPEKTIVVVSEPKEPQS